MSAYCLCGACKVRDMKAGLTPWCFGDVDRGTADGGVTNIMEYVGEIGGQEHFKIREYVAYRRKKLGIPADEREEWREHLIRIKDNLSPRQQETASDLLALI